jgi:hypothetical protein
VLLECQEHSHGGPLTQLLFVEQPRVFVPLVSAAASSSSGTHRHRSTTSFTSFQTFRCVASAPLFSCSGARAVGRQIDSSCAGHKKPRHCVAARDRTHPGVDQLPVPGARLAPSIFAPFPSQRRSRLLRRHSRGANRTIRHPHTRGNPIFSCTVLGCCIPAAGGQCCARCC